MPKRKALEPDPDAFERMARELGCDETGEEFERALAKVLPPRRVGPSPTSEPKGRQPTSRPHTDKNSPLD